MAERKFVYPHIPLSQEAKVFKKYTRHLIYIFILNTILLAAVLYELICVLGFMEEKIKNESYYASLFRGCAAYGLDVDSGDLTYLRIKDGSLLTVCEQKTEGDAGEE